MYIFGCSILIIVMVFYSIGCKCFNMASSKLVEAIGYYKDAQDIYKESEVIIAQAKELVELTINSKENNNDDTTESIYRKED